jgi:hypothetical protein
LLKDCLVVRVDLFLLLMLLVGLHASREQPNEDRRCLIGLLLLQGLLFWCQGWLSRDAPCEKE